MKLQPEIKQLLDNCDRICVAISGGKDSVAATLVLLENGYRDKIELHHHLVDGIGQELVAGLRWDWDCTEDYLRKLASHWQLPIYFSYREGGFNAEMLRCDTATGAVYREIGFKASSF